MKGLTDKQRMVTEYIRDFIQDHSYPPTIREIASHFDISVKAAFDHVKALEKKKTLKSDINRSRSIEIMDSDYLPRRELTDIPVLGSVAAGLPILSEENYESHLSLPHEMLGSGSFFALRVRGDSMIDAGIQDGDIAVIKQTQTADDGEIIVARIQEEAVTLKRFYREQNRVRLQAENPAYPPIYTQNIRILGKLKMVIRDYA